MLYAAVCSIALLGPLVALANDSIACPQMPAPMTDVNRNLKSEIAAKVGSLGRVNAGELGIKTEIEAQNLFSKFPNVDRLVTLQTMAATYCTMLKNSSLSETDRIDRWERFQDRILGLQSAPQASLPARTSATPSTRQLPELVRPSVATSQSTRESRDKTPSEVAGMPLDELLRRIRNSSSATQKEMLKTTARARLSTDLDFGSVEHTESDKHYKFSFVSYDPLLNVMLIDENYEFRDPGACNPICPAFVGRLTINLNKVDRLKTYNDGFDLDCWYSAEHQNNRCIEYRTQKSTCPNRKRCDSGSDQNIGFYIPNNARMIRFRNALQTIIYKIDGRPPI